MVHESRKRGCAIRHRGPYIDRALIVRVPANADNTDAFISGKMLSYCLPGVFEIIINARGSYRPIDVSRPIRPALVIAHDGETATLRVHLPALP